MPEKSSTPSRTKPAKALPDRALAGVEHLVRFTALWGGGAMLFALTGLTVTDVVLRYVFNAPLFGARDAAKLMLLIAVALSVAYSARTGGQVAIEVFSSLMGPRITRWTEVLVRLAALGMLTVLSWRLWISGLNAGRFGEASLAMQIPFKPFYFILSAGMLLYALVLVVEIPLFLRGGPGDRTPPAL